MDHVLDELRRGWAAGRPAALATVVSTAKSAPRRPGAALIVSADGTVTGSVSGGCVEGAVYELATEVLASGRPVLARYGVADDEAFAVGLTCGGTVEVFVQRVSRQTFVALDEVLTDIEATRPVAIATVIDHPDESIVGLRLIVRPGVEHANFQGRVLNPISDRAIADDAWGLLHAGRNDVLEYGAGGERMGQGMRVFVQTFAPPPRMIVFGAIDFARATARMGKFLGFRVTVCDARALFATEARFPEADEVVVLWPHKYLEAEAEAGRLDERTVVCVLTHDPKFDVPVLEVALRLGVGYVGAMGSRRTHDDRLLRLREAGLGDAEIAKLHSPLGLDLGARTPEETAVSIAAEIVAMRWGGSGAALTGTTGPIHVAADG